MRQNARRASTALAAATLLGLPLVAPATQAAEPDRQATRTTGISAATGASGATAPQGAPRGRLLSARPLRNEAALPSAAHNYRVRYTSVGARGQRIVVSGTVALPEGRAPRQGWPVMSWAHGTTGTADACAPSRDTAAGPAHDYLGAMRPTLDQWVARGFAVVQTDYEGLGTPGPHPYINGDSAANTVADIVRAARQLDRRVGRDWVAVGHSQGGQAALFTAAADDPRRDIRLRGAISLAPGGMGISGTAPFIASNQPGAQQAMGFLATILVGAAAADPAVDPEALLTDRAEVLLDAAATECQPALNALGLTVPPTEAFEPGADLAPLTAYLAEQEPEHLTLRAPTLVLQGTADQLVAKTGTDFLVGELRSRSDAVLYVTYEGADHRGVVSASFADQLAYAEAVLRR